jgi:class 3 adenylate cyclase/tetratricopeptide (TPR) repeat protein
MQCPRCQHENPPGMKFCGECAAPLAATCPSCGAANPPENKFCGQCAAPLRTTPTAKFAAPDLYTPKHLAEKILTSRAALEGERKQVTVLFADLKGSMELLADRDPEEARKLLDPVLERMMEAVHRYEGTVNQVMGDGIMALFGAPLAHEDHAVRACYAALRMQDRVRAYAETVGPRAAGLKIRVGLNSGEVVVRAIGSDLHMDYTAVGQTTHLAARMEQIADPGTIVITPGTLARAEGYVEVRSRGPVPVKGLAAAVEVYEVTGAGPARTRLQAGARRGLTRFVGRDLELRQLRRALQLAADGHGQVVAIVGEAGLGKSRLVHEFTHSPGLPGWRILEAASVSYGKATSYAPVIDLLKGYFSIRGEDDREAIREKVTGKLLGLDQALRPTLSPFLTLLDLPVDDGAWQALDPPQRRQRTLDAVKRLLLRESQVQPVLAVFEDLHWVDSETQALLDGLVESLPAARVLLLVNYRPGYRHGWGDKTYYTQLRIDRLSAGSAAELLHGLLGEDASVEPLARLLIERTDGNPFFLEESVLTLIETKALTGERGRYRLTQPVQAIQVAPTVQVMLAVRIDRLAPEDKRLLQVASTVGKDVPLALLQAVADLPDGALRRGLDRLQAGEFLYETSIYPDLEYSFKHALTHETAYGGLLQARRRELHARIVAAIETLHPDRLGEQIERLAYHAVRGELREKAVHYLRQAGLKAAGRSAPREARAWLEQALGVLQELPESPTVLEQGFELCLELRPVLVHLGENRLALERLRDADRLAERLNDDRRRGRVCTFVMSLHTLLGELDDALTAGTRAQAIARQLGDTELRILNTSHLEQVHLLRGEYERVVELATENLVALSAYPVHERFGAAAPVSVYDRLMLVQSLAQLGRFAEAAEVEARTARLAEETEHAYAVSQAHFSGSTFHLIKGEWTAARSRIEPWIMIARAQNILSHLPWAVAFSAWVLAQLGATTEALGRYQEGRQLLERLVAMGLVGFRGWIDLSLGHAALLLGRLDEAHALAARAVEDLPSQPGSAAYALHLLGDIATHPDRFDAERGEAHYRQALALAEPRGMRPLIAHCHLGLGKLYRRTGRRQEAQKHLVTATTMYREMGMRFWLEQAEAGRDT